MEQQRSVKHVFRNAIRPAALMALPTVEAISRRVRRKHVEVRWRDAWTAELDEALDQLPEMRGCPHQLYRLLMAPTQAQKCHAMVYERGELIAVISLRKRRSFWEPISQQCPPAGIAPAKDNAALGRALAALGVEVRVVSGLGPEVTELHPRHSWDYEYHLLDLKGDFEEYWRERRRMYTIKRARKTLAQWECRVDDENDLEWIVEHWRQKWANDSNQEVVATEDRIRFWRGFMAARTDGVELHAMQLLADGQRTAGLIFTHEAERTVLQCGSHDPEFDKQYCRAACILATIDWCVAHNSPALDFAGGDQRLWAPVGGKRYGAIFRPRSIDLLARIIDN